MAQRYNKWTEYQDNILTDLVQKYGTRNWSAISNEMKKNFQIPKRNGKQCRQRWFNQLDQSNQHTKWTNQQDLKLLETQAILGTKWMDISHHFPGRSDNNVKNRFYSIVKKGIRKMCRYVNIRTTSMNVYAIKPSTLSKVLAYGANRKLKQQADEQGSVGLSRFTKSDYHEITQIIVCFIFDNNQLLGNPQYNKEKVIDALNKLMEINSLIYNKESSSDVNSPQSSSEGEKKETSLEKSSSYREQIKSIEDLLEVQSKMQVEKEQSSNYDGIFSAYQEKKPSRNKRQEMGQGQPSLKSATQLNNAQDVQLIFPSLNRGLSQMSLNQNFFQSIDYELNEEDNQARVELKFYTTPKYPTNNDVFNNFLQ